MLSTTSFCQTAYSYTEFTVAERTEQLHYDKAPAHSTAPVQAFLAKHHITQVCQPPYSPDLALWDF